MRGNLMLAVVSAQRQHRQSFYESSRDSVIVAQVISFIGYCPEECIPRWMQSLLPFNVPSCRTFPPYIVLSRTISVIVFIVFRIWVKTIICKAPFVTFFGFVQLSGLVKFLFSVAFTRHRSIIYWRSFSKKLYIIFKINSCDSTSFLFDPRYELFFPPNYSRT